MAEPRINATQAAKILNCRQDAIPELLKLGIIKGENINPHGLCPQYRIPVSEIERLKERKVG